MGSGRHSLPPDPHRLGAPVCLMRRQARLRQDWAELWSRDISPAAAERSWPPWLRDWFRKPAAGGGFSTSQSIVMLERTRRGEPPALPPGLTWSWYGPRSSAPGSRSGWMPPASSSWQPGSIQLAFKRAVLASVAEADGRMVGYQLSARNPFRGSPGAAGRAAGDPAPVGRALVCDLIEQANRRRARLTVNTQSDNSASHCRCL